MALRAVPGADAGPDLDALVQEIRALHRRAKLDAALAIGRLVVERFGLRAADAEGNLRKRFPGYRALVQHEGLGFSHSWLHQRVQVALQYDRLPAEAAHLSLTHHRHLLLAPDDETRSRLVAATVRGGWTERRLKEEVARVRVKQSAGGRPPDPLLSRAVESVEQARRVLEGDPPVARCSVG